MFFNFLWTWICAELIYEKSKTIRQKVSNDVSCLTDHGPDLGLRSSVVDECLASVEMTVRSTMSVSYQLDTRKQALFLSWKDLVRGTA
jgi:hypothetical protein